MKYMVRWTLGAEQDLAEVWINAADRVAVTRASHAIEQMLAWNPATRGLIRFDSVRMLAVPPLGVDFEVVDPDCTVWVLSAWDTTKQAP